MSNNPEQGTNEWLAWRNNGLGASDAPIIMNASSYCTPYQLWQRKLGLIPAQEMNFAMQRGHDLEPIARKKFIDATGIYVHPDLRVHPEIGWLRCSLDGISDDGETILEIKCVNRQRHEIASYGKIPEEYYPQLQHQMAVCQLDKCFYLSYNNDECIILECQADTQYITRMLKEEKKFWDCLQNLEPPELTEKDYVERNDFEWNHTATQWKQTNQQIKDLEKKLNLYRETLIKLAGQSNSKGCGINLSRIIRKGIIDYSSLLKDHGILDTHKYRKEPTETYRILENATDRHVSGINTD